MTQTLRSVADSGAATPQDNVAMVRKYFAAISGKDKSAATVDAYVADEGLKKHIAFFEAAFPRFALVPEDLVAQDDRVAARLRFQGTHAGDLMGIAPTGKSVDVPFIIIYRMASGRIAEHWMSIDQMEVLKQLGVAK